jgi:hypothetical protein
MGAGDIAMSITIQLTKGMETIVSDNDSELAAQKWIAAKNRHSFYAYRSNWVDSKKKTVYLHRVIMGRVLGRELTRGEIVDHKDGNTLNNCRENLRLATQSQNAANSIRRSDNTSGFKGVYWSKKQRVWYAVIWFDGKRKRVGSSDTAEGAFLKRLEVLSQYHGEFARGE